MKPSTRRYLRNGSKCSEFGSHSAIDASRKWRKQVRLLDPFTHGHNTDGAEWLSLEDEGGKARMTFYEIARADLAIKQPLNSELPWPVVALSLTGKLRP